MVTVQMGNDRSALSLLVSLNDSTSAEAYCVLEGAVIPRTVGLLAWAELLPAKNDNEKEGRKTANQEPRTKALLKILMEIYTQDGRQASSNLMPIIIWP